MRSRESRGYQLPILNSDGIILPWTQLPQSDYAYQPMAMERIKDVRALVHHPSVDMGLTDWVYSD